MKAISVKFLDQRSPDYTIHVGVGALGQLGQLYDLAGYSKLFVIADETMAALLPVLTASLGNDDRVASLVLPADENLKRIDTVQRIWTALHRAGCDRKSLVINVGGGVICDVGGFAAATYMRGLDCLNVPTTLLSQVDASVGGKTGFNFDGVKNLIGTFSQPVGVLIDPETLKSLPPRQFLSGFAEIIKHGLTWDADYLKLVTAKPPLEFSQTELTDIIARSCQIKVEILSSDVSEKGPRKIVNFGHTIGHAIEVLSLDNDAPLTHGEAISLGMVVETDISRRLGLIAPEDLTKVRQIFKTAGLLVKPPRLSIEAIIEKTRSDKKNEGRKINYTLLKGLGRAVYDQQVDEALVKAALQAELGA